MEKRERRTKRKEIQDNGGNLDGEKNDDERNIRYSFMARCWRIGNLISFQFIRNSAHVLRFVHLCYFRMNFLCYHHDLTVGVALEIGYERYDEIMIRHKVFATHTLSHFYSSWVCCYSVMNESFLLSI